MDWSLFENPLFAVAVFNIVGLFLTAVFIICRDRITGLEAALRDAFKDIKFL